MEVGVIGHNFEMGHSRKIPAKFNLVQWLQRRIFKCEIFTFINL